MVVEMIVSLAALGLAGFALMRLNIETERFRATTGALQVQQGKLTSELSARLKAIGERFGDAPAPAAEQSVEIVSSALAALERRVSSHESLLCALVTDAEAKHLWNLSLDESMTYQRHDGVEAELRSLVTRGLMTKGGAFNIHELPNAFELREHFCLTESGRQVLTLRKHLKETDLRPKTSMPPRAPESSTMRAAGTRSAPPPFVRPKAS
jgi:hypothetical protein